MHPAHDQRYAQLRAQMRAVRLEIIGGRLQPVVDVNRPHLTWPTLGAGQQHGHRIGPTTQGHRQRKARTEGCQGLFGRCGGVLRHV
jgi:hypothetical protein